MFYSLVSPGKVSGFSFPSWDNASYCDLALHSTNTFAGHSQRKNDLLTHTFNTLYSFILPEPPYFLLLAGRFPSISLPVVHTLAFPSVLLVLLNNHIFRSDSPLTSDSRGHSSYKLGHIQGGSTKLTPPEPIHPLEVDLLFLILWVPSMGPLSTNSFWVPLNFTRFTPLPIPL